VCGRAFSRVSCSLRPFEAVRALNLFRSRAMLKGHTRFSPDSAVEGRNTRLVTAGVGILSGIVLICIIAYFTLNSARDKSPGVPAKEPSAELVSAGGMVLVQSPGNPEWREVKTGAHFSEGDLVRTDSAGEAGIRYKGGAMVTIPQNTVFTVRRPGDTGMEITPSPDAAMLPLLVAGDIGTSKGKAGEGPFIELQQIIPFGKSLELIGRVEAGSHLAVNNESVEVSGEGLFKHFTRPFPSSVQVAQLSLKVTDLAGRTRIYAATHDFRPNGERN